MSQTCFSKTLFSQVQKEGQGTLPGSKPFIQYMLCNKATCSAKDERGDERTYAVKNVHNINDISPSSLK